jgi:uncharacterized membrane protein
MMMSVDPKTNIVWYSLHKSFLLTVGTVGFVLIVTTVAFAFGATAITVGVAAGLLVFVIMLAGVTKMRAQLKRELQGDGNKHP